MLARFSLVAVIYKAAPAAPTNHAGGDYMGFDVVAPDARREAPGIRCQVLFHPSSWTKFSSRGNWFGSPGGAKYRSRGSPRRAICRAGACPERGEGAAPRGGPTPA